MARIELEITGNATGLEQAAKKASAATNGLTKATGMSRKEIEAWDKSARRNTMEQYGQGIRRTTTATQQQATATKQATTATDQSNSSLIRHTYAQRAALSASNNLAHSFSAVAAGGRGAASSIGIATRQLATLSTVGIGATGGMRALASAFMGPSGVIIGISAGVTALISYISRQRDAKKSTDDLKTSTSAYIETLQGVARAQADGQQSAEKDLTNLRLLYEATQNLTLPMESRRKAAQQLIDQYPKQFQGLSQEAVLAGNAASAYNSLTASITATAMAMASADRIRENSNKMLDRRLKIVNLQNKANLLAIEVEKERVMLESQGIAGPSGVDATAGYRMGSGAESRLSRLLDEINTLGAEMGDLNKENIQLQSEFNSQIAKGADLSGKVSGNIGKTKKEIDESVKLQDSLNKLTQESIQASLSGYQKELQASQHKYDELRRQADAYYREGKVSAKEYADYIARLQGFRVGASGRIIQSAGSNAVPLGQGRPTTTGVVPTQLPNQVAKVVASDPVWDEFVDGLDKQLGRAVQHFGRDFLRTLSTINQQANVTFGGILSNIVGSLTGGVTEVMSTVFTQKLSDAVQTSFKEMGPKLTSIVSGIGIAGSVVSGAFKQTSVGGQALGGALSGAGAGLALGGPVGAVIGGAVGAISGALSAASAKKIQEQQLAEERKQTALLERANALSYASSIMGQMTAGGAVTGIMRDAFGQLVATVKGSDLQFVLQRSGGQR